MNNLRDTIQSKLNNMYKFSFNCLLIKKTEQLLETFPTVYMCENSISDDTFIWFGAFGFSGIVHYFMQQVGRIKVCMHAWKSVFVAYAEKNTYKLGYITVICSYVFIKQTGVLIWNDG